MTLFPKLVEQYRQTPDLRHRVLYTALLLLLFRSLALLPALNVDEERLHQLLANNPLIGTVDLFAGGEVMTHFSVVAAGIFPYLLALALAQGATYVVPPLRRLRSQGEHGQKQIEYYAKILTVPLAFIFAWGLSQYLSQQTGLFPGHLHWFSAASFFPSLRIVCLVTAGSLVSTGITAVITQKGIGSGKDIILLGSASLVLAKMIIRAVRESSHPLLAFQRLGLIAVVGLVVVLVSIYLLQAVRRVPIQFAARQLSTRLARKPPSSFIPLPFNSGRILPVSAAMGLLALLQFAHVFLGSHFGGQFGAVLRGLSAWATPGSGLYWIALACLIVLFTYICNFNLIWQSSSGEGLSLAEELRRRSTFIPGVRPGRKTEEYLVRVMTWITLAGGLGLAFLAAVLPYTILRLTQQNVIVTVLTLMVAVQTFSGLLYEFRAYRITESYAGFFRSSRKRG